MNKKILLALFIGTAPALYAMEEGARPAPTTDAPTTDTEAYVTCDEMPSDKYIGASRNHKPKAKSYSWGLKKVKNAWKRVIAPLAPAPLAIPTSSDSENLDFEIVNTTPTEDTRDADTSTQNDDNNHSKDPSFILEGIDSDSAPDEKPLVQPPVTAVNPKEAPATPPATPVIPDHTASPSVASAQAAASDSTTIAAMQQALPATTADIPAESAPKLSSGFGWGSYLKYAGGISLIAFLGYKLVKHFTKKITTDTDKTPASAPTKDTKDASLLSKNAVHQYEILTQLLTAAQKNDETLKVLFNQAKPHLTLVNASELKVLEILIDENRFDDCITFITTHLTSGILHKRAQQ